MKKNLPFFYLIAIFALCYYSYFFMQTFIPSWSDENIHLAVAAEWIREGSTRILYGDLHTARPPLVILLPALFMKMGLDYLWTARMASLLITMTTALTLFIAAKRMWNLQIALLAFALFFFSPGLLARVHYTGIDLLALFSTLTILSLLVIAKEKRFISGILAGITLLAGQHAGMMILLSFIWVWRQEGKRAAIMLLWPMLLIPLLVLGGLYFTGGTNIFDDLIGHHLYHFSSTSGKNINTWWWLGTWFFEHLYLFVLIAPFLHKQILLTTLIVGQFLIVLMMKDGQVLYIYPAYPLLVLFAAYAVGQVIVLRKRHYWIFGIAVMGLFVGWLKASADFAERDKIKYPWNAHVRMMEMFELTSPTVAELISKEALHGQPAALFGYPTITNLVALQTGGRIAGGMVDFDPLWIRQGRLDRREIVRKIEADRIEYFITPAWFFTNDPFFKEYLERHFSAPKIFDRVEGVGRGIPRIFVFKRLKHG